MRTIMVECYCRLKTTAIDLLVKWFNTLPSQGSIHGFETHTGHHIEIKLGNFTGFYFSINCHL